MEESETSCCPMPNYCPPSANSIFKWACLLVGILFAVGLFFNAYLLWQKPTVSTTSTPVATVQPSAVQPSTTQPSTTTPSADPTAGWKTYTNTKYKVSIKYPSTFGVSGTLRAPSEMSNSQQHESVVFMKKEGLKPMSAASSIQIDVLDNIENLSLAEWAKSFSVNTIIGLNNIGDPVPITINNYKAYKLLGKNDIFPNNEVFFFQHKDKFYTVTLSPSNQAVDETVATFGQMLPTLRFID